MEAPDDHRPSLRAFQSIWMANPPQSVERSRVVHSSSPSLEKLMYPHVRRLALLAIGAATLLIAGPASAEPRCSADEFEVTKSAGGSKDKVVATLTLPDEETVDGDNMDTLCIEYDHKGQKRTAVFQCTYSDGWVHRSWSQVSLSAMSKSRCSEGKFKADGVEWE